MEFSLPRDNMLPFYSPLYVLNLDVSSETTRKQLIDILAPRPRERSLVFIQLIVLLFRNHFMCRCLLLPL